MSAVQNTVYLHVCERIATVKHNSDMIKQRISGSISGGGLGWKGESARRALAASLSAHFAQSAGDGHLQVQRPGDVKTNDQSYKKRRNGETKKKDQKREHEVPCERSDSMEPLRGRVGEEIAKEETESYVGWYTLNSRKMRQKKLEEVQEMYRNGRRFAPILINEETSLKQVPNEFAGTGHTPEAMTLSSHHRDNAQVKVSSNLDSEVDDLVLSNHAHSTDALLRNKPELNTNYDNTGTQCSRSEPYPSSPPAPLPQPPSTSRSCRPITPSTVQRPKFSVWPSDRSIPPIANKHRQSPALVSSFSTTTQSSPASSRSRSRSRTGKQDQSDSSTKLAEQKAKKSNNNKKNKNDDNDIEFPPNHPFHGLDAQQRRTYRDTLSLYPSSLSSADPKDSLPLVGGDRKIQKNRVSFLPIRHGFGGPTAHLYGAGAAPNIGYAVVNSLSPEPGLLVQRTMGRVSEATSRAVRLVRSEGSLSAAVRENVREERVGRKRGSSSRLRDTFACRPGSSTPEVPARTVENEAQPADVAVVPRKYGMTYLARKMRQTPGLCKRSKAEQGRVHEENREAAEAASQQNTQCDISAGRKSDEQELETLNAELRKEDTTNGTDQNTTPPAQLPKDIGHTPESTLSASSASPVSDQTSTSPRAPSLPPSPTLGIPKIRATSQPSQPQQRRCVSSGSLTLSDRLRTTRLEDLRLRSETAQEIRNLMLDIDRDRRQSMSTATDTMQQQRRSSTTANHAQLPGGFTTADRKPSDSSSLHNTIQRHFQPRRNSNVNDNDTENDTNGPDASRQYYQDQRPVRLQTSYSTLPRSYKAPDVHE